MINKCFLQITNFDKNRNLHAQLHMRNHHESNMSLLSSRRVGDAVPRGVFVRGSIVFESVIILPYHQDKSSRFYFMFY